MSDSSGGSTGGAGGRERARVPPGQGVTAGWPVLHVGAVPTIDATTFRLSVGGDVDRPADLGRDELRALPRAEVRADLHCVTGWSRLDNLWEGVLLRDLAAHVRPDSSVRFVRFRAVGAYETGVPLDVALDEDVLVAWGHDGRLLSPEHGGPLRAVVPKRYGWKSCKWLAAVEFLSRPVLGFWEVRGYHERGDPWREERLV